MTAKPPCVNGRHTLHSVRQGVSCDRPKPPPPAIERAVGAAVLFGVWAGCVGIALPIIAAGWWREQGRLRAELMRRRLAELADTWQATR